MTTTSELAQRNAVFAASGHDSGLTINPRGNMMIVGCVDPRVDPAHVLGLSNGEAAIIRNVGGRITPATLRTMTMLGKVGQANADTHVPGTWNLVIMHHTDCGMTDLAPYPELLAAYFEVDEDQLPGKWITDPHSSIRVDVAVILAALTGSDFLVSGLVYDVATGRVEVVEPPTPLRST
ncbi:carbonic anhydrase [Mycobacterium sp.]|uniref:carbonic anhydrase n=1 Tax=Mycobacterium sp. TaxID=1785 RepID=UPI0025D12114|nr:carbonic anhydrase [Mycobacterium sp.]